MEKFVNELMASLLGKIRDEDLKVVRNVVFSTLKEYDVKKKENALIPLTYDIPKEVKEYIVAKRIEGLSYKTLQQYWYCLKLFFESVQKQVTEITAEDIRLYLYNYQKTSTVADITLDSKRLYLHSFFEWLTLNDYIKKNPCSLINPIKYEKKVRQPLNDIEMEKLRQACSTPREKAFIEVLYSTGCRVSELTSLKVSDIDFEKREVSLFGKGKKHRKSYLNARAIIALHNYINHRESDSEYVFTSEKKSSKPIHVRTVQTCIKNLGEKAGIQGRVYPHRIRHTTATDALSRGMAIEQVQTLLGHEKTSTTLIYAKIDQVKVKMESLRCIV